MARHSLAVLTFAALAAMAASSSAECNNCQTGGGFAAPIVSADEYAASCESGHCGNGACASGACGGKGKLGCLGGICSSNPRAWQRPYTEESQPDVFYNFYQPGNGGAPAGAFPAPYPTPPITGHSYYTYQPFMPNEWLYQHHRTYHQAYNNGLGLNRTSVAWYAPPIQTGLKSVRKFFSLPR